MAILIDGVIGRISEVWGEIPSPRVRQWLWMRLKFFRNGSPIPFSQPCNSAGRLTKSPGQFLGGEIELELEKLLVQHASMIPALKLERQFIQSAEFDWIDGGNVRQLLWLVDRVHKGADCDVPEARVRLGNRDYFICLIDLIAAPVLDKQTDVSGLHQMWIAHLKITSYLKWFSEDDETERCNFAWEALESRLNSTGLNPHQLDTIVRQQYQKYRGSVGLKCYFDSLHVSDYEKKSHVDHIKKLWSQKKYRTKLEKNKVRQRNFVLSDATIKSLDKLAKKLGISRTEALEQLIELSVRHGLPSDGNM